MSGAWNCRKLCVSVVSPSDPDPDTASVDVDSVSSSGTNASAPWFWRYSTFRLATGFGADSELARVNHCFRAGRSWKVERGRIAGCSGRKHRCRKVSRVAFSRMFRGRY